MRRTDNTDFAPPAVGGASLLVVFAVLCLTVFALLSLTTVRADDRLSQASAKAVSDYYNADCEAQRIIARIKSGEIPDGVKNEENIYEFECPVSDTKVLTVRMRLENGTAEILRCSQEAAGEWNTDDSLHVWDGSEME